MKIVNVMNFVRRIDEREENSTERLLAFTAEELRLVNDEKIENTFLLQYDALCDKDFVNLFKSEATERTELGLWYEIVEPQTTACGLPYRSENGWKWDWHIVPGYPMAYTPAERELLIDEAMRKFRETFGHYPKTVAGWVIDTYTLNYLAERYDNPPRRYVAIRLIPTLTPFSADISIRHITRRKTIFSPRRKVEKRRQIFPFSVCWDRAPYITTTTINTVLRSFARSAESRRALR